jgi:hypothetical protein
MANLYTLHFLENTLYQDKDDADAMIASLELIFGDFPSDRALLPDALALLETNLEQEEDGLTKVRVDNIKKVKDHFGIRGGKRKARRLTRRKKSRARKHLK